MNTIATVLFWTSAIGAIALLPLVPLPFMEGCIPSIDNVCRRWEMPMYNELTWLLPVAGIAGAAIVYFTQKAIGFALSAGVGLFWTAFRIYQFVN